jgi:AraC-like DNA-binding protein
MNISYQEYHPSAALQPYIDCYWHHQFDGASNEESPAQYCVPLGTIELIHALENTPYDLSPDGVWSAMPSSFVVGLTEHTGAWKAIGKTICFGIRLRPETLFQLFKVPASIVFETFGELDILLGKDIKVLSDKIREAPNVQACIKVSEDFFMALLQNMKPERNYVIEATRLIRSMGSSVNIDQLSDTIYISKRQLQRGFKELYGTSPKTYQRIIRFSNAYNYFQASKVPPTWTDISYTFGYSDYGHLIKDFKDFTGDVPRMLPDKDEHFYQSRIVK